jgi:Immunoglobulin-like domain of bacterial spore germination
LDGSPEEGWTASVVLRPYIAQAEPPSFPGPRHTLSLIGLEGAEHPAWFVAGLESENIAVNRPEAGDPASSPLRVSGAGVAYEGTLHARIEDDAGNVLLRPDSQEGILMAEPTSRQAFSGDLGFRPPVAPSGILILSSDSGVGPTLAVTIVRLRFD